MDGEVIDLGKHKLRFLETPHVHHWDSMMLFDETTKSVFPSDLFIQPGDQPPVVTEDLGGMMCDYYREIGIFAHEEPVRDVVDRIEALDPDWIHGMHGGSLTRESIPYFMRALREEPFAYQGKLLGLKRLAHVETRQGLPRVCRDAARLVSLPPSRDSASGARISTHYRIPCRAMPVGRTLCPLRQRESHLERRDRNPVPKWDFEVGQPVLRPLASASVQRGVWRPVARAVGLPGRAVQCAGASRERRGGECRSRQRGVGRA